MRRVVLFLAATAVTSVFFIDFCNLVYGCGCRSLWAGADASCNIHTAGAKHCPWCSIGLLPSAGVWAAIVASQAIACFGFPRMAEAARVLCTLAAFPVTGGILAIALGLWTGYWH